MSVSRAHPEFRAALLQTLEIVAASFVSKRSWSRNRACASPRAARQQGDECDRGVASGWQRPIVGALAWRFILVDGYGMIDLIAGAFGADGPRGSPTFGWRALDRGRESVDGATVRCAGAVRRSRQLALRAAESARWPTAPPSAAACSRHAAAAQARHRLDLRGQAGRRLPHFRRRLCADRRRTGERHRRDADLHLPADVHRARLSGAAAPTCSCSSTTASLPRYRCSGTGAWRMMRAGDPASRQLADAGIYGLGLKAIRCRLLDRHSFKPTSEILVTPTSLYHAPDPRALPHRAERGISGATLSTA